MTTPNIPLERIICSAININWIIFVWKRHFNCIKQWIDSWIITIKRPVWQDEQWFYTSEFRYVDRYEWLEIAEKAWQLIREAIWMLFSEDLR